ncbi:hypothetical protein HY993_04280 [Candidatus Micrarchaeota archaeon]|nr:hypothetical protein [Candidatus Micrarchaeota archaeon]
MLEENSGQASTEYLLLLALGLAIVIVALAVALQLKGLSDTVLARVGIERDNAVALLTN